MDDRSKNLTLRLPDEYHRQLVAQAARQGATLNGLLIAIINRHLLDSGYAPGVIKSFSGRLFEICVDPITDQVDEFFCSRFDVFESHPLYNKRRAHYIFGVAKSLIGPVDPYDVVKDVGLGMLNFYNRRGLEIDQLAWQTNHKEPAPPAILSNSGNSKRFSSSRSSKNSRAAEVANSSKSTVKDNWRYIGTSTTKNVAQFLVSLARDHWKDELLALTGQSQDIRYQLRQEDDLYR